MDFFFGFPDNLKNKSKMLRDALAEQKQNPLSIDDVTAMIAGQTAPMDEETADLFQQLTRKMIEQAGG